MDDYKSISRDIDLKDGSPLRRYMDLPKYVDLLRSRTLYLRRADKFADKFEGAVPPNIRAGINSARLADNAGESADDFYRRCRMSTFISCWTSGAKDNMALWQLFGGTSNSLAISTTVGRVTQMCAGWSERTHIAKVKYIDHFENPNMILGRSFDTLQFKHEAFEFEREVRVILPQTEDWLKNPEDMRRPISNLDDLIMNVVVAPDAKPWFFNLVKDLGQRYGLKASVKMSQLAAVPT